MQIIPIIYISGGLLMEFSTTNNLYIEKRVACLYRVSTKGQVDNNDIPLQKKEINAH